MSSRRARRMDPGKMPPQLREFVPMFELYGVVESDAARFEMADAVRADPERLRELEDFAVRFTPGKLQTCDNWLGRVGVADSYEAAKVYAFFALLGALEIELPGLDTSPAPGDFVAHALAELQTFDTPDARAGRMFAAQSLGERGPSVAARATEALRAATHDTAPDVAAWAHAALALVTVAAQPAHRAAILKLIEDCEPESIVQSYAEDALAELDKPAAVRDLGRLCGACIMNDLETIRELLATPGRVDVNGRDHNGQSPIEYAVASDHPEALELLLAAGADPNTRSSNGLPVLHDAAARRKGKQMIPLLLRAGASVKARDRDGHTAVVYAIRHKRDENARLLRSHGVPAS